MTNAARMKILTPLDHAESGALNVVQLANDDDPFTLKDGIAGIDRIELHFPHFTDGRAYSQAYLLRRRLGFRGDLRATGDERHGWRVAVETPHGIEAYGVLVAPTHERWRARILTFPNVLVTGHQAFFTAEALAGIAETTVANLTAFERDGRPLHPVSAQ